MHKTCRWFLLLWLLQSCFSVLAKPLTIYIRDDVYQDYLAFLNGRDVLELTDFSGSFMRRDVADMVLLQQALKLGGFHQSFQYLPGKVNFRNTKMLENGELLLSFDTYWLSDAAKLGDKVYISSPIVKRGQYMAGIYASPANSKVFAIKKQDDLKQLTAVSTPKWHTDWATLSALPLKELIREDEWLSQARMVHMQWVDFMLMPFYPSPDGSFELEQIKLQLVPGVAVLLDDSRHFVISKQHPQGKQAYIALNKGLSLLEQQGRIEQLYSQAGFFIDQKKYKVLNTAPAQ
jgi:hypothetical protein